MGKRLDKANENITILVEELIDARRSALGSGNCIYWNENNRPCDKWDRNCECCKEAYWDTKREELLNKYIVKNKKE